MKGLNGIWWICKEKFSLEYLLTYFCQMNDVDRRQYDDYSKMPTNKALLFHTGNKQFFGTKKEKENRVTVWCEFYHFSEEQIGLCSNLNQTLNKFYALYVFIITNFLIEFIFEYYLSILNTHFIYLS